MKRRPLPEHLLELRGIHRRDPPGVERADPALQLERARERLLYGNLLVEREADQQRERLVDEQPVGLVVAGEAEPVDPVVAIRRVYPAAMRRLPAILLASALAG